MLVIARIIGVSLLTALLGAWLGASLFGNAPESNAVSFVLACLGSMIGALAGTAREIGLALRRKPSIGEKPFD
jgi:hypothetical protein